MIPGLYASGGVVGVQGASSCMNGGSCRANAMAWLAAETALGYEEGCQLAAGSEARPTEPLIALDREGTVVGRPLPPRLVWFSLSYL